MSDFLVILQALNLPESFLGLLEEIPEELQHYIIDDIVEDILSLNDLKY